VSLELVYLGEGPLRILVQHLVRTSR
jgi:hypothetical protein